MAVEGRWSTTGCESSGKCKNAGTQSGGLAANDLERELASYDSRSSSEPKKPRRCVLTVLIILSTASAIASSVSLYLDSFVGVSEPGRTLDLPYPRLENEHLSTLVFNDSIPNTVGIFHKYIDLRQSVDSKTVTVRKGVLSQCDKPLATAALVRFVESPWLPRTCTPDGVNTFFCPVVVIRLGPGMPEVITGSSASDGCFTREQRCDGILDCPSGHDEVGCTAEGKPPSCLPGASPCPGKNVCVDDSRLCNGLNDCGMYEDESSCCGVDGFIRCNDGRCVAGSRCDGHAECVDLSDEYNCPTPSDDTYFLCDDGQLIEGRHVCDAGSASLQPYQCRDLSDETHCSDHHFTHRRGSAFDRDSGCFLTRYSRDDDGGGGASATAAAPPDDLPPDDRGGRSRSFAASAAGYESALVAVLSAFVTSFACSWVACLLVWLSACARGLRHRSLAAARLLLLCCSLLFVSAAAQCAVVVYWCLYVGDVKRELRVTTKQPSVLVQVFRETLLALGVELHFKTSFVLTAASAAAHLVCIVLGLVVRRGRLSKHYRLLRSGGGAASFGGEGGDVSVHGHFAKTKKKKEKKTKVPLLSIGTADHWLNVEGSCVVGGEEEEDGGERQSLPEKASLDSASQWSDVDKEKLRAFLDDADDAAAATREDDEEPEVALLPSACVGRQGIDVCKPATDDAAGIGDDSNGGSVWQSGTLLRLTKSRTATLPSVLESEHEGAEDAYINVARRADDDNDRFDASSSSSSPLKSTHSEGDRAGTVAAPPVVTFGSGCGSQQSIGVGGGGGGGAVAGQSLPSSTHGLATAAVAATSSGLCRAGEASDRGGGRGSGGTVTHAVSAEANCLADAGSSPTKRLGVAGGWHGDDDAAAALVATSATVHDGPESEPLLAEQRESSAAAVHGHRRAAGVGTAAAAGGGDDDDHGDESSIKGTADELGKPKESHVSAFAAPPPGRSSRAGR